ncbi:Transferrin receptor-like, PAG-like [Trypanosoma congolense IL3000]|uniref:Transferrin receptor-like, PAG-like n=1 Tax=Trypanosoma congolense (strain IL3000) TaxID=1068625 RepID=F9WGY2_TRYCI|nr:Transferrin receptor-like, PAG-like [Trypanosoma congolense IL3000]
MERMTALPLLVLGLCLNVYAEHTSVKLEVMKKVCNVSKTLKTMHKYVTKVSQEADLRLKDMETVQKLARIKVLKQKHDVSGCNKMAIFIHYSQQNKADMKDKINKLWATGLRLTASAGIAAGRLDEFVSIFMQAYSDKHYCVSSGEGKEKKQKAQMTDLKECYKDGTSGEFLGINDAENVDRIKENLRDDLNTLLQLDGGDPRHGFGEFTGCQLTMAETSYISNGTISKNVFWGDGIFGVRMGSKGKTGFKGSTRAELYKTDLVWEDKPLETIPTLKVFMEDFERFNQLYKDIVTIDKKMEEKWSLENINKEEFLHIVKSVGAFDMAALKKVKHLDVGAEADQDEQDDASFELVASLDEEQWIRYWDKILIEKSVLLGEIALCKTDSLSDSLRKNRTSAAAAAAAAAASTTTGGSSEHQESDGEEQPQ